MRRRKALGNCNLERPNSLKSDNRVRWHSRRCGQGENVSHVSRLTHYSTASRTKLVHWKLCRLILSDTYIAT